MDKREKALILYAIRKDGLKDRSTEGWAGKLAILDAWGLRSGQGRAVRYLAALRARSLAYRRGGHGEARLPYPRPAALAVVELYDALGFDLRPSKDKSATSTPPPRSVAVVGRLGGKASDPTRRRPPPTKESLFWVGKRTRGPTARSSLDMKNKIE
jgi:hypothetical protein